MNYSLKYFLKSAVLLFVLTLLLFIFSKSLFSEEKKGLITEFEGINLDVLKGEKKDKAIEFLNKYQCSCPCKKENIAECFKETPDCRTSKGLAKLIISSLKNGVPENEIDDAFNEIGAEKKKSSNSDFPKDKREKGYDVEAGDAPYKGVKDAPVTIVEFSDYQCPFCSRVEPTLDKIMESYKGKVKLGVILTKVESTKEDGGKGEKPKGKK